MGVGDEWLATSSIDGAAGGGNGGSDELIAFASVEVVLHRLRFEKPHGCDWESRMSMDTNVGGGVFDVRVGVALSSVLVQEACRALSQENGDDAVGRCGASHDCRKSRMLSLRVHKRCTSET